MQQATEARTAAEAELAAARMRVALETGKLCAGEAKKLGGGLQWAGQKAFKRLGRAMLRPIQQQER